MENIYIVSSAAFETLSGIWFAVSVKTDNNVENIVICFQLTALKKLNFLSTYY